MDGKGHIDNWRAHFSARELREIEAWRTYAREFGHVSGGVNPQLIAARMADLLDAHEAAPKRSRRKGQEEEQDQEQEEAGGTETGS